MLHKFSSQLNKVSVGNFSDVTHFVKLLISLEIQIVRNHLVILNRKNGTCS